MGYYVQTPGELHGKAEAIANEHDGIIVDQQQAVAAFGEGMGVICVVNNGPFEAAAFAYSRAELEAFCEPDPRQKTWVVMDYAKAAQLSGYKQ